MPSVVCARGVRFRDAMGKRKARVQADRKRKRRKAKAGKQQSAHRRAIALSNDVVRISERMNWNVALWFGKHKGERLIDAPPAYLLWLHRNCKDTESLPIQGLLLWIGAHKQELQRLKNSQLQSEKYRHVAGGSEAAPRIDQAGIPEQSPRLPEVPGDEPKGMA